MRRVVITGLGIVCPIGNTLDETWESVKANRCGVGEITAFDTSDTEQPGTGPGIAVFYTHGHCQPGAGKHCH